MTRILLIIIVFIVLIYNNSDAQNIYTGGNNDGFSSSNYSQADNLAIYTGGNNDGFGFSSVGGIGSEVSLPIELLSFIVYVKGTWVNLEWQTASETNNDFFTLEKKSNATTNWEVVKKIKGAGNSDALLSYKSTDNTPYEGVSYYRLKQTDFDGMYSYSKIKMIKRKRTKKGGILIYPNPTNDQVTIHANKRDLEDVKVLNSLGQDVTYMTKQVSKSDNNVVIDISGLSVGIYTIKTNTIAKNIYIE